MCQGASCRNASWTKPSATKRDADQQRQPRAAAAAEPARDRAREQHHERRRQQEQAGLRDARAEPVAGGLGHLHELRDQQERPEHAEADHQRGDVGRPDRAHPHHPHVHERLRLPELVAAPDRQQHEADGDQPEHRRRGPAPGVALADRDEHGAEAGGEQRRSAPVDLRGRLDRRLGDEEVRGDAGAGDHDQAQPEDPRVVEVVDDHAREHEAGAAADPERRRDQADAGADALARELVADDPEREREDRAAEALDRAPGDQHLERVGERADQRAERRARPAPGRAGGSCRTCRRAGRAPASRSTRSAGRR